MSGFHCWQCGAALDDMILPVSRREECRNCRAEIHACRMCVNFDPHVSDQCREDRAEPPNDKEHANFCDWFKPSPNAYRGAAGDADDAARKALDDLFGGGGDADQSSPPAPDDLFDLPKKD